MEAPYFYEAARTSSQGESPRPRGQRGDGPSSKGCLSPRRCSRSSPGSIPFSQRFDRLACLGQGSQGVVHLCRDRRAPASYSVVKIARPEAKAYACLASEVRCLWALRGARGVPALRTLVYRGGLLCGFATPYLDGETLDRLLRGAMLSRARAARLSVRLCEAVLGILSRGFLHRDLKPENILCTPDDRVFILDFGLARRFSDTVSSNEISGTLAYASPEQIDGGRIDPRSDLFSLGLILYEIATGKQFFSCDSPSFPAFLSLRDRRLREHLRLEGVEPALAALIRRLLVKSPRLRADAREVELRIRDLRSRVREAALQA